MRTPRVLLAAVALLIVIGCQTVPITGRSQLVLLPEGTELKMGLDAYEELTQKSKLSTDPARNELVTRVGRRIAEAADRPDFQWEFRVFEDKAVNAFCLPGGKIGVYTGILPVTRDDAGLAAVLGHEVAHATARHSGERVSQQLVAQLGVAGLQGLLGVSSPQLAQLGSVAFAGLATGGLLAFGRAQELEADRLGLVYMAKAGYHPSAARDLWLRMAELSKGQARPPVFLSTHPSPEDRIQRIESWIPETLKHYRPR